MHAAGTTGQVQWKTFQNNVKSSWHISLYFHGMFLAYFIVFSWDATHEYPPKTLNSKGHENGKPMKYLWKGEKYKVGSEFSDRVLKQVFVGQTKETLDLVDYDLVVAEVLSVFGRYMKYNAIFSQEEM